MAIYIFIYLIISTSKIKNNFNDKKIFFGVMQKFCELKKIFNQDVCMCVCIFLLSNTFKDNHVMYIYYIFSSLINLHKNCSVVIYILIIISMHYILRYNSLAEPKCTSFIIIANSFDRWIWIHSRKRSDITH